MTRANYFPDSPDSPPTVDRALIAARFLTPNPPFPLGREEVSGLAGGVVDSLLKSSFSPDSSFWIAAVIVPAS